MANKGAPSGILSIVDRRCARRKSGSQEKEGEGGSGAGKEGGKDVKEWKVRSGCGVKGKEE